MNISMIDIKDRVKSYLAGKNKTWLIVAAGLIGIVLIMLSELIPDGDSKPDTSAVYDITADDTETYRKQVEQQLEDMLGQIKDVGKLDVMVTIEGTTEYVYAQELDTDNDKDGERTSEKYKNKIVMSEKDGDRQALVRKMIKPQISGVMIVCQGGGQPSVKERVIKAAATALDLPSGRICVECMGD